MNQQNLWNRNFILVVAGQIISLFGNSILRFALPLYLLRETGSAAIFGVVTACSFLPMIILSFLGGILADRVNKRNIMVGLDFLTGAITCMLTLTLDILPLVPLLIVVLMLLYGISGTYQPAVQASIPILVPEKSILTGSAIINQIASLSGLLGPIIGGVLFGTFGIMPILIISTGCFIFSSVMELFISIPFVKRSGNEKVLRIISGDIKSSFAYIRLEKPELFKIILLLSLFNLVFTSMIIVGVPVLIVETLQMSDRQLGFCQGISALGGLCGGIFTASAGKKLKLHNCYLQLIGCAALSACIALALILPLSSGLSFFTITAAGFFMMALATMFSVQMIATVQIETPAHLVGKVIALMISVSMCAQPAGQMLYGLAFEHLAEREGLILAGCAALSAVIALRSKKLFHTFRV